jgi:hypothetical protein
LKATVIPVGAPVLVRATSPVKLVRVSVTVLVPCWPCWILTVAGFSANAIVGVTGAVTVTVSVVVWFVTPAATP